MFDFHIDCHLNILTCRTCMKMIYPFYVFAIDIDHFLSSYRHSDDRMQFMFSIRLLMSMHLMYFFGIYDYFEYNAIECNDSISELFPFCHCKHLLNTIISSVYPSIWLMVEFLFLWHLIQKNIYIEEVFYSIILWNAFNTNPIFNSLLIKYFLEPFDFVYNPLTFFSLFLFYFYLMKVFISI